MKAPLTLFCVLFSFSCAFAQNKEPDTAKTVTVSFRANPADSMCNYILNTGGCKEGVPYQNAPNETQVFPYELPTASWTCNYHQCNECWFRSLLNFGQLTTLPANATITSATLNLYGWEAPTSTCTAGNSYYPGSPYNRYGTNEMLVKRITQPWKRSTVKWVNQPATDNTNFQTVVPSTKQYGHDISVDVTKLVQDMAAAQQFHGFMLMMQDPAYYRSMGFHSCFAENPSKRPELILTYSVPGAGTAINNVLNEEYLKLYPVPAGNILHVDFTANASATISYTVQDMRGAVVATGMHNASPGMNVLQLDISNLAPGIYVFSIKDGQQTIRRKLVKQ